jgi:hypothetical protein
MRHQRALIGLAAVMSVLSACNSAPSGLCDTTSLSLEVRVTAGAMEPSTMNMCQGQDVTLTLHSEVPGIFHVHGFEEWLPPVAVEAGQSLTLEFTPEVPGQYLVHLHDQQSGGETEIGLFAVYEP